MRKREVFLREFQRQAQLDKLLVVKRLDKQAACIRGRERLQAKNPRNVCLLNLHVERLYFGLCRKNSPNCSITYSIMAGCNPG